MPYHLFCRFSSVQHSRKRSSTRHHSRFPLCTGRRIMVSIDFISSENYTTCIQTHTHIYIHTHTHTQSVTSAMSLCDPMNCSPPGSSVHRILLQEYWSGFPYTYTHTHTYMKIYYVSKHWKMCLFVSYLKKTLQYKARYLKTKIITPLGIIQHLPKQYINFK